MAKRDTTEDFVIKARKVHGDKYIYDKVDMDNRDEKGRICIICPIHGDFWQTPHSHLKGEGCTKCGRINAGKIVNQKRSKECISNILKKCEENDYTFLNLCDKDGNECEWKGIVHTYLHLKCNKCGNIWNTTAYREFINRNHGCKNCNIKKRSEKARLGINIVLDNINKMCQKKNCIFLGFCCRNGEECEYKNAQTYLKLKCLKCDNIWTTTNYDNFIRLSNSCPQCGKHKILSEEEAIDKVTQICNKSQIIFHGFCNKDGKKIDWGSGISHTYLKLECKKCGRIWQTTSFERSKTGLMCNCNRKWILEELTKKSLINNHVVFDEQKKFDWLGKQSLDFYLPEYNVAIECQGKQHFGIGGWSTKEEKCDKEFQLIQERDERKRRLCEENGVKLLYYSNLGIEYPYKVYENLDELLEEIKSS